ncbi:hypothetical protein [Dyella acidiphila]|uniref:Uncharacterized protein n=1 Tax=Dyella acidiphila TaxID=2775866 RepID=A0ABR9G776_9GAMM|nr:hypothetical protein [Dyella acidiphila]MBE1159875.1 hypothetical protein [Dyella acidiphila]
MKITGAKIVSAMGKAVLYVFIAAGVLFLLAERFHETSVVNFIRSLM